MKHLLLAASLLFTIPALAQTTGPHVGRAAQLQGKYVFYYAQPMAAYDVAFTFASTPTFNGCPNVAELADACLKSALMEAGAQNRSFDAIIIGTGSRDIAIKFKAESPDNGLERVDKRNNAYTFIMAQPVANYTTTAPLKVVVWEKMVTGRCYTTTQVIDDLLKRAAKEKKPFDAVIYNGPTAEAVKYQ